MSRQQDLERRLRTLRAPDEAGSEARAWEVARSAYAARQPVATARRHRVRLALVPVIVITAGVLALTPAGATVHRWIDQTLGVKHASPELFALPAPGRILVSGAGGTWTVAADGSKRRLGQWRRASWSPHGWYVVVVSRDQLAAVDTRGVTRWAIARPEIRFPRWYAPNGYRVAYLSGETLRVIAGDGTGDGQLVPAVSSVAPAWRPGHDYQLAYVGAGGAVVVRDADTDRVQFVRRLPSRVVLLAWSADGARLLALTRRAAAVYSGSGRTLAWVGLGSHGPVLDAELSPDGHSLALLSNDRLTLTSLAPKRRSTRLLFSGDGLRQLGFSPDGQWLLVSWPAADQWIFVRVAGTPRIEAVSRIAEQFGARRTGNGFPSLEGWCCVAAGGPV
jgi:hypothetical protein